MGLSIGEKILLMEIRDLLREALLLLHGVPVKKQEGINVAAILRSEDPIEAIREHNRQAIADGKVRRV